MPGLPPDLHQRLCSALIASGYCDSADVLRAVCVDARVAPWRDDLPDTAPTRRRRAEAVVAALWDQRAESGENALALLLHTLSERFDSVDARRATLADLVDESETATPWTGIDVASLTYARLHTLPAPPTDFVGREAELAQLLKAVEGGGATIHGLRGMGGVGKTTLALKLAQTLTVRYPDAQFYLDLRGVAPHPLTPAEVMTAILRAYHPTARLPEDAAQLQPLYCAVLNGQRALLLLDNAKDAAQLRPLLPPASCLLLVTSRQRFTLPGLRALDLDALPKPEAETLLREIAPRVGNEAGTLADLCGCLPVALRWAGEALNDTTVSVPRFLERLQTERRLLEPATASLRLSYDLLPPDLQALWRQLSVFPGDFDWEAAAAVWDLAREPAEDALDALARRSLLTCADERYTLHDLARLWAGEQTTKEEYVQVVYRHAAYYLQVLWIADTFYKKGNTDTLTGLALYDREAVNIHSGQRRMANLMIGEQPSQSSNSQSTNLKITSEYPNAGAYILHLRLHPLECIVWWKAALHAARIIGDRSMIGNHLGNLGNVYQELGNMQCATEYHELYLEITHEIGDRYGESAAQSNLGNDYDAIGDSRQAIKYHMQALKIAREIRDRKLEGAILGNLGLAYSHTEDMQNAIEFYKQALDVARDIGDLCMESTNLGNLGNAYASQGNAWRAIEYHEQALSISRKIRDKRAEGQDLGNLGNAYTDLGDTSRAIEYYKKCLVLHREIGGRGEEGKDLGNLGLAYAALGDARRAIEVYEQQLVIVREIGDRRGEGNALANMGQAHKLLGEPARARDLWQQALAIYEAIEDPHADWVRNWLATLP